MLIHAFLARAVVVGRDAQPGGHLLLAHREKKLAWLNEETRLFEPQAQPSFEYPIDGWGYEEVGEIDDVVLSSPGGVPSARRK